MSRVAAYDVAERFPEQLAMRFDGAVGRQERRASLLVREFGPRRWNAISEDGIELCRRFPQVARQLQDRHAQRHTVIINDEYDVQDLFHGLLRIDFDDIRDEEWTPSYAGSCSRVDFLLKSEQVVIEIKKSRQGLGAREVGEQLLIDIARYRAHPDCRSLVCFVYDPEHRIGNPRGLEGDLTRMHEHLDVRVIISPNDG